MNKSNTIRLPYPWLAAGLVLSCIGISHADQTVSNTTLTSGQTLQVADRGKLVTTGSTIEIQSGSKAVFIGGSSVTLSPGFHAASGAIFRATQDLNLMGFDNLADSDFDGLPDAWELLHFGNLTAANGTGDNDGDGIDNAAEYRAGTNPLLNEATATMPGDIQVVTKTITGKFRGVKTDWSLIAVP